MAREEVTGKFSVDTERRRHVCLGRKGEKQQVGGGAEGGIDEPEGAGRKVQA